MTGGTSRAITPASHGAWRYQVTDLSSANGTYVGDERIAAPAGPLRQGDRIRLGHIVLRFQIR